MFSACFVCLVCSSVTRTSAESTRTLALGDIDGNGSITTADARMILEAVMNTRVLDAAQMKAADYNSDGNVDASDARLVLRKAVGISDSVQASDSETFRAVWIALASGDFPSKQGMSEAALKAEIDGIVKNVKDMGLNAIVLQVRAYADAIYESSIFPSSYTITGTQGKELPFDILDYFIKSAHSQGIELHAWINPYRVTSTSHSTANLSKDNPALTHPELTVKHFDADGSPAGIMFNPGLPESRQLILDGIMEIVNNYDVDGIHMDDYFYPYTNASGFEDSDAYAKYGNGMSLADWRRNNVDILVQSIHDAIKTANPDIKFGISPFGVWAKKSSSTPEGTDGLGWPLQSYSDIYADSRKWVVNNWVDYICPQLYWHIDYSTAPFKTLTDWWDDLCAQAGVDLYVGIAAYKGSTSDAYKDGTEIRNQLEYLAQSTDACKGVVFFSYRSLTGNMGDIQSTLQDNYGKYVSPEIDYPSTSAVGQAYKLTEDSLVCLQLGNSDAYGPTEHCMSAKNMYETVLSTTDGYSLMSNGFYVPTESISKTSEIKYLTVLQSLSWNLTPKRTEFIVPCSQNVSFTMWMGTDQAELTLYNLYSTNINLPSLPDNPLFSSVTTEKIDGSTVKICFKYKQKYHIFGYTAEFINGRLVISFKNPVSLRGSDQPLYGIKISLDPGHSNTVGAVGTVGGKTYRETDLTLDLAHRVKQKLEDMGAIVRLTHNGERDKSLYDIIPEYIAWEPDINVSIHFNSSTSSSASGNEVWWCYNNSNLLAQVLCPEFCETTGIVSKGPKCGYYLVSKLWQFPSVLFETFFISNQSELSWYVSGEAAKNECADGIVNGIVEYFSQQS